MLLKKTSIPLFSTTLIILPILTLAAETPTLQGMADAAVQTALYVASAIVVILWIVTGVLFLVAQGDPEKINVAKRSLIAAIVGTVIIIVAAGAINLVGSAFGI